jgi:hypothetical protein
VSVLLFVGVEIEKERVGVCVERKESVMAYDIFGWDGKV